MSAKPPASMIIKLYSTGPRAREPRHGRTCKCRPCTQKRQEPNPNQFEFGWTFQPRPPESAQTQ